MIFYQIEWWNTRLNPFYTSRFLDRIYRINRMGWAICILSIPFILSIIILMRVLHFISFKIYFPGDTQTCPHPAQRPFCTSGMHIAARLFFPLIPRETDGSRTSTKPQFQAPSAGFLSTFQDISTGFTGWTGWGDPFVSCSSSPLLF